MFPVDDTRDLEGQVPLHLSESLFELPSFYRSRTIASLGWW